MTDLCSNTLLGFLRIKQLSRELFSEALMSVHKPQADFDGSVYLQHRLLIDGAESLNKASERETFLRRLHLFRLEVFGSRLP